MMIIFILIFFFFIDLGPKGTSARFNDRDRRGRYDNGYHNGGGPRRRSGSRDRRPSYGGGYRNDRRSRSKDRY